MTSCILAPDTALRSWSNAPYAYVRKLRDEPVPLSPKAFETALACDGTKEIPESEELKQLISEGAVIPCRPGEKTLTDWQRLRTCPNPVMPWLALEITGRCNYSCLHCFNAADNSRPAEELSAAQLRPLLDEAADAGVQAVLITGGEPLLHREFREIVSAVYERNMSVHEINTNGSLLDRDTLDFLRSFGRKPEIKISFDGTGRHDMIRGKKGAEEETLRAVELCVREKFPVRMQVNLNRLNRDRIRPTLELLAGTEAQRIRVIRTTETPRWTLNAPGGSLSWEEYYQAALEEAVWYARSGLKAEVCFWQMITLRPRFRAYRLNRVRYNTSTYRDSCPLCPELHGMPALGADGRIYPCLQYSGFMNSRGIILGNALETGLTPLLRQGPYFDLAHARVSERLSRGEKCASCRWHTWCAGGCPALGYLADGSDFYAHDPSACLFFENGWPERIEKALPGWINLTALV